MMVVTQSGERIWLIGDPHIGKTFQTGVPLHRRGEREAQQLAHFKEELATEAEYIVVVGDIFDHPYVSHAAVIDTYSALVNEAARSRDKTIIVIAGNHDMPRNLEARGAFHLLEAMCHLRADNLFVHHKPIQVGPIALFPWQWDVKAKDQVIVGDVLTGQYPVELVVGHWDLKTFDEKDDHLAPTASLRSRYPDAPIYSGHYHVAGEYEVDGHVVICTGSLEPYTHGEDPDGEVYVTLTLDELDDVDVRNKCVRVLLREGEELPVGLDCLSLVPKRVSDACADNGEALEIERGTFEWAGILEEALKDVPEPVCDFINERLRNE